MVDPYRLVQVLLHETADASSGYEYTCLRYPHLPRRDERDFAIIFTELLPRR